MNVFKRFIVCYLPPILVSLLCASISFSVSASDFATSRQSIEDYRVALEALESAEGYFSYSLLEPLQQLATAQLAVNRLDAAEETMDRAAQITRIEDGLYTPLQYPFLQQAIEIEITRGDWEEVAEKIKHYTWLIGEKYRGNAPDRLSRIRWIAGVHLRGSTEDSKDKTAAHLIQVTSMNEIAMQYAQVNRIADDLIYAQLLLDLANAYLMEAQAIRGGGRTSYRLRRLVPGTEILDKKKDALNKRYLVGLEKLEMHHELIQTLHPEDDATVAQSVRAIADWHQNFGREELAQQAYERATEVMHRAELPIAEQVAWKTGDSAD